MGAITRLFARLTVNWVATLGTVLSTCSAFGILFVLLGGLGYLERNIYLSTFLLLGLPGVFVVGLVLLPIGLLLDRKRRLAAQGPAGESKVVAGLTAAAASVGKRRAALIVGVSFVNLILFSLIAQKTVHHVDSAAFCGTTCHTVMEPEWSAYNRSPHSRVACVQCHIGPGASWAVKAKINGFGQVVGVMTGRYHRPIPTPVEHLRPSRDTCEQCHWPQKLTGNRVKVFAHYDKDKSNTPKFNVMLMHVGGEDPVTKKYEGIHWHVSSEAEVRYEVLDHQRKKVGKITVLREGKVSAEYSVPGETLAPLAQRTMDCIDCHNRPTHLVDFSARTAVERAIYSGMLDPSVPYLVKVASDALVQKDLARETAGAQLRRSIEEAYRKEFADSVPAAGQLDKIAAVLEKLFKENVYPSMQVGFGTYASNLGHRSSDPQELTGCFRCHDRKHATTLADGKTKTLSQSCELCHESLATDEDPAKFDETLQAMVRRK
jgi:nitrate/TMAO reductase-like tetraheme cytochrome c subunit